MLWLFLQVDWENEKECFQTISAVLGNFYAIHPPVLPNPSGSGIQFYKKRREGSPTKDLGNALANPGILELMKYIGRV